MKQIVVILLMVHIGFAKAQYTAIPDNNFEQELINQGIDSEGVLDGQVLTIDIENVEYLDVNSSNINNLIGIEDFTNLIIFNCSNNFLVTLDLSNNINLEVINCSFNESITNVNLNNLINLDTLFINVMFSLTELNLNENINLKFLSLGEISCSSTLFPYQLSTLDLSNNVLLEGLYCIGMPTLNSINLNNCVSLRDLVFRCNATTVNLDLNDCINLENLNCSNAHLTTLNLQNNINLKFLNCGDTSDFGGETNKFNNLDLSQNVNLIELKAQNIFFDINNPLYEIDLSNNPLLENVDLDFNFLDNLNIANGNNENLSILRLPALPIYDRLQCVQVDNQVIADIANADQNNWVESDDTVYSIDCETVSVNDETLAPIISISPNPVNSVFTVNIDNEILKEVSIFNATGQLLKTIINNNNSIDISNYEKGVYFIKIFTDNGGIYSEKIIKE